MAKSSGALQVEIEIDWCMLLVINDLQVLDICYLGIEENQISKLTEGHLTSEGLRWSDSDTDIVVLLLRKLLLTLL